MRVLLASILLFIVGFIGFDYLNDSLSGKVMPEPEANAPIFYRQTTNELAERNRIATQANVLLSRSNFAELEKLAERYREAGVRSPSGLWNLTHFYTGVGRYGDGVHPVREIIDGKTVLKDVSNLFHTQPFDVWRERYPESPTPYVARAVMLRSGAWKLRGNGYADTVSHVTWAPFIEKLKQARDHLEKHRKIASRDPHWYALRISIGLELGEPADSLIELMYEGIEKEPYYYQTYFSVVRIFLPEWGGDPKYIQALANMAVEKTEKEDGLSLYARIFWAAAGQRFDGLAAYFNQHLSWDRMKAGMDDILAKYPDSWNVNNLLRFACFAEDRTMTRKILEKMEGDPVLKVWGSMERFEYCRKFALGNVNGTMNGKES